MNNVRGCYDRIVHIIVILVLMSFGVSGQIVRALFKVLQDVDHHMTPDLADRIGRTAIKQYLVKVVDKGTVWVQRYMLSSL